MHVMIYEKEKLINMDMLRVFFEISDEDTSKYFVYKAI